jgi:YD repeat-containing protein
MEPLLAKPVHIFREVSKIKNKNALKFIAVFMSFLVFEMSLAHSGMSASRDSNSPEAAGFSGEASMGVKYATGDMYVSLPLLTVPGRNGLNYQIDLGYTSGGGVRVKDEASWVGLGWSLGPGAVERSVIGLPDDMQPNNDNGNQNVYVSKPDKPKIDWWMVVGFFIIGVVLTILSFGTGTLAAIAHILSLFVAVGSLISNIVNKNYGSAMQSVVFTFFSSVMGSNFEWFKTLMDAWSIRGAFQSTAAIMTYISTMKNLPSGDDVVEGIKMANGFLYAPTVGEDPKSSEWKNIIKDGGSPDLWSVSGMPGAGAMFIANNNNPRQGITGISDAKFYMQITPSLNSTDVQFFTGIPYCLDDSSKNPFFMSKSECERYSEDIDMFIFTGSDGTKYVYGDPKIEGAVVRIKNQVNAYWKRDYKKESLIEYDISQPYAYAWKLTAILSPDYVDGGGDRYNPLDLNEADNKGSWIAFRYNLTEKMFGFGVDEAGKVVKYSNSSDKDCEDNCVNSHTFDVAAIENCLNGCGRDIGDDTLFYSAGLKEMSYPLKIITPTHEAEFHIEPRDDGKETMCHISLNYIRTPWDPYNSVGASFDICPVTQGVLKFSPAFSFGYGRLKYLDYIIVKRRGGSETSSMFFDGNYRLQNNGERGKYTLNRVYTCDNGCIETKFYYDGPNPNYPGDYKIDSWGMYYEPGTARDYNGPSNLQSKFKKPATDLSYSYMLTRVELPTGTTIKWDYESDTWFTSRGDLEWYNHYAALRGEPLPYSDNYGGGVRVKKMTSCNGLQTGFDDPVNCIYETFSYKQPYTYNGILYYRSSGVSDAVPFRDSVMENEYDMRERRHMASTYISASVLYNRVCVYQNTNPPPEDGSAWSAPYGYECHYYLTTESNPSNTDGATDSKFAYGPAAPAFSRYSDNGFAEAVEKKTMTTPPGGMLLDRFSEQTTDYSWKRGQEYLVEYYSGDKSSGNNGLLKTVKKNFHMKENAKVFYGGGKMDDRDFGWDGNRLNGFASGWPQMSSIVTTEYDYNQRGPPVTKYVDTGDLANPQYDPVNGLPLSVVERPGLEYKEKTSRIIYAYENYPGMLSAHIISLPWETKNYDQAGLIEYSQITYKKLSDGRWYADSTKNWLDKNYNGYIDSGEMINLRTYDYDNYGNIIKETDAEGKWAATEYDPTGMVPVKGWNSYYGSSSNPLWKKTYDPGTFLLKEYTNENGLTTRYEYDYFGRLLKVFYPEDSPSSPSIEYIYKYNDPEYPKTNSILTRQKMSDSGYYYVEKKFFDGDQNLLKDVIGADGGLVKYDAVYSRGQKTIEYKPYYKSDGRGRTPYTSYEYYPDSTGMVKSVTSYDSSGNNLGRIEYKYGNMRYDKTSSILNANLVLSSVTVMDEERNMIRYGKDVFGNTVLVEEGKVG